MNNQFWGDERDFYKYALLRILAGGGDLSIGVCWMLTRDGDPGKTDTHTFAYLRNGKGREKDCELFDFLQRRVCNKETRVRGVANMSDAIIPGAEFFGDEFPKSERAVYWEKFIKAHGARELLFLDPDTGIKPDYPGNAADEYIRVDEIARIARECKRSSLMIFQCFNPLAGKKTIEERREKITRKLRAIDEQNIVLSLYRAPVAYYFLIRKAHKGRIDSRIAEAVDKLGFSR